MREIQLRDAKAKLSAVVDEAMRGKPAVITRHGKRAAPLTAEDLPSRDNSPLRKSDF